MEGFYDKTGTLAPLLNEREYSEDEKVVLLHFFTNVDRNVYCATDAMSSQLWAFLMGQYSRSTLSLRDRFLQLFDDARKAFDEGKIKKDDYVSLEELAEAIRSGSFKTVGYFNDRASDFLKKWGVDYGHNSLKDSDKIRIAVEGVSQVFAKVIEAPFPTLGDFQEKSTRYVHFGCESVVYSPALINSKFFGRVKKLNEKLIGLYERYLPVVKDVLVGEGIIKREDFKRESAYERTLSAKAFDVVRYLLPSGVATSLGCVFSARVMESHLSWMLSHPIEEVRLVAKVMHEEALKLSPGLLTFVSKSDYCEGSRDRGFKVANEVFSSLDFGDIFRGVDDSQRVNLIDCDNIDDVVCASILFEHGRSKGVSFSDCIGRVWSMSDERKEEIMRAELGGRGPFDRMPRSVQHGRVMFEFMCDFGAYRDIQRHRASGQIWQGASAVNGYDYPEFVGLPGMVGFKKDYDEAMGEASNLAREMIEEFPYETEYVCALGHLIRTSFEMHPGQLAYVIELRTTPQGHQSYRRIFQKVYEIVCEKAPIFSKFIRVNEDVEASRKKQEEASAKRREELGI